MWGRSDLPVIVSKFNDTTSEQYLHHFRNSLVELTDTNTVAKRLNDYISQAIARVCPVKRTGGPRRKNAAPWFDRECRARRSEATKAGDRVTDEDDRVNMLNKCKECRACKQRKQRQYRETNLKELEDSFKFNKGNIWKVLDSINRSHNSMNQPSPDEFLT